MMGRWLLIGVLLCGLSCQVLVAADRPNILFLFADDHCYRTLRGLGNDEVRTPNLDRLMARGTTFRRTYNSGGWHGAICVASRTMLNTGLQLWKARAAEQKLRPEWLQQKRLWPQRMSQAGYQTFLTGKWHVSVDAAKVFETVRHVRGGMPKDTPAGYGRPTGPEDHEWLPWDESRGGFWEGGRHWSEVVADDALDFLKLAQADPRPFFIYAAFNAPHDPRQSPRQFVDLYPAAQVQIPASFVPRYPHEIDVYDIRDEKLAPLPRTEWSVQVNRQEYYAIITHMDQQIGRILDALEASGEADRTWIFFTADHGLACGNHGLMGKQNLYDHSVRVPFVVCGPEVPQGVVRDEFLYLQDVMPTTLQLAGSEIPDEVEFRSLLPLLSGAKESQWRDAVTGSYMQTQRMITVGNEKLLLYPKIQVSLLYDLAADPEELRDASGDAGGLERKRKLFRRLLQEQQQMGDDLDLRAKFPELAGN
jgi:choline-sulfatase